MTWALPIIVLAGFLATIPIAMLRARWAALIATLAAAVVFALVVALAPGVGDIAPLQATFWSVPALAISGGLAMDGLSLIFALLISGIGVLVFLYSGQYLKGHPSQRRVMLVLVLFMAAMLGAVLADDVILLFVFWEITSLASYLLVGTDSANPKARKAALKALLVTGGGGLALLAGLILVSMAAETTSISGIIANRDAVLTDPAALPAMLLIILGCFTKSAQLPFHFWLPAAMAAPTPVSAYLHSATMVKLGVYLLARFNPVYAEDMVWQNVLTWVGLATAATGAFLALRETDLKAVLAYTTVTALGTLVLLIGLAPDVSATAAMTFLIVHALYKAAFFMLAGIVDHKTGMRDLTSLGGLRRAMPITATAAVLAALSMAGLPPFVGFVGKELLYASKIEADTGTTLLLIGGFLVNATMVAIAGVLSYRLFFGAPKPTPKTPKDPHWAMFAGPILLAGMGLIAGGMPNLIGDPLVQPAATAMLGHTADVKLKLWHGFNVLLALSAATVAAGVVLFALWQRVNPHLSGAAIFDRLGPSQAYEAGLAGLVALCSAVTARIQHGSLAGYLRTLFLTAGLALLGTLIIRGGFAVPDAEAWNAADPRILTFVLIAIGAVATALAKTFLTAIIAMGLVGFATAVVFLSFGAPDVAFTQFAVETLMVVILAAAIVRLPISGADSRPVPRKLKDATIAVVTGGAVSAVLLAVLATDFDPRLSEWFGAASVPEAQGRNVVNVILVDFRALDTLGEITVLAIAAFAIVALLRATKKETAQ
jgi:multicomponent Na+:H+ antiporter subunit A